MTRTLCIPAALAALLLVGAGPGDARPTDARTGLIIAPGWELVSAHCGGCHSHALVTSQRGDEGFWRNTIRWMQRTQNLWQIPPDQEVELLRYLAKHYNEGGWGRRPPLPENLMPTDISRTPARSDD